MLEKKDISLEKAVLIGVITQDQDEEKSKEYLDELEFLTYTAGGDVLKRFTQKVDMPNPKTFIGSGKMDEVKDYVDEHDVGTVIFDDFAPYAPSAGAAAAFIASPIYAETGESIGVLQFSCRQNASHRS